MSICNGSVKLLPYVLEPRLIVVHTTTTAAIGLQGVVTIDLLCLGITSFYCTLFIGDVYGQCTLDSLRTPSTSFERYHNEIQINRLQRQARLPANLLGTSQFPSRRGLEQETSNGMHFRCSTNCGEELTHANW